MIALEEGLTQGHLSENAANRPYIDGRAVVSVTEEELNGAIPACRDFCQAGLSRQEKDICHAKVDELDIMISVE